MISLPSSWVGGAVLALAMLVIFFPSIAASQTSMVCFSYPIPPYTHASRNEQRTQAKPSSVSCLLKHSASQGWARCDTQAQV